MNMISISPTISSVDLVLFGKVVTAISAYRFRSEEDKERFYDYLRAEMQSKNGKCIVPVDFNGHVGKFNEAMNGEFEIRMMKDS